MRVIQINNSFQQQISAGLVATAKKLLPRAALSELRRYHEFSGTEKLIYLQTRIRESIRVSIPPIPGEARSFLFLCYGNIMRSPMCEALMKRELARLGLMDIFVTSAGLNATAGRPAHPWAVAAAREFGISLDHHRARAVTRDMVDSADVILVMDYQNYIQLYSGWQPDRKKVFMLSAYLGPGNHLREIADPYYLGESQTIACYEMLEVSIRNLLHRWHSEASRTAP